MHHISHGSVAIYKFIFQHSNLADSTPLSQQWHLYAVLRQGGSRCVGLGRDCVLFGHPAEVGLLGVEGDDERVGRVHILQLGQVPVTHLHNKHHNINNNNFKCYFC